MSVNEVISSGLLESYVLGTATAEESAMIRNLCRQHPELVKEIEAIEEVLMNFSAKISVPLNKELKNKIASRLNFEEESVLDAVKLISMDVENEGQLKLYKFGVAASLLLFLTSLLYNVQLNQKLRKVNGELAELNAARSYMTDKLKIQQTSLNAMNAELQVVADPKIKTIALKGMNSMDKRSAMVHWNMETHEVYFNATALPGSPASKQYQLWAIVDGKPVNAGMIDMGNTAQVFQKMKSIKGAQAFAVTIEKMGGSPTPTMDTMCLLGTV